MNLRIKATLILVALSIFMLPAICPAKLILSDDCEDIWKSSDWLTAGTSGGNSISVSTDRARAGAHSYKFVQVPNSSTNVELILQAVKDENNRGNFIIGQEYWIGYSLYLPKYFNYSDFWTSPQFHNAPDSCDSDSLNPNIGFFVEQDHTIKVRIGGDPNPCSSSNPPKRSLYPTPYTAGQWNDIVLHFRSSYNSDGFFEMFVNGHKVRDDGPNTNNDAAGLKFKMGIYAHPDETMTLYYDEIKIGDQNSSYDEVSPGGAVPNQSPTVVINSPSSTVQIEEGQSVTFACTAADSDGSIASYLWDFDTSGIADSHVEDPGSKTFSTAGTYLIRVTVTDDDGAPGSATRTVIVTEPSQPPPVITGLVNNYLFEPGAVTADAEGNTDLINNGSIATEAVGTEPDPPGYGSYGAVLNGSSQYFSVASYSPNNPWQTGQSKGTFIIAAKLNSAITETKYLAGRWDTDTSNRTIGLVVDYPSYQPTINLGYDDGASLLKLQLGLPIVVGTRYIFGFTLDADARTWRIEAYDADAHQWLAPAYGTFTETMNLAGTAAWYIGRRTGGPSPLYFPGTIYWARTYNTILSSSEIRTVASDWTPSGASTVIVDTTGGTPYLELETGGTDLQLQYVSGSGTGVLTWQGTVTAGMQSLTPISPTANGIVANGGSITGSGDLVRCWSDESGHTYNIDGVITIHTEFSGEDPVDTTMPTAGSAGSLAYESPIYIDQASDYIASMCACDCDTEQCFEGDVVWKRGQKACIKTIFAGGDQYVYSGPFSAMAWPYLMTQGGPLEFLYRSGSGSDTWIWYAIIGPDALELSNLVMSSVNDFISDRGGEEAEIRDAGGNAVSTTAPQTQILPSYSVKVYGLPETLSDPSASGVVIIDPSGSGQAVSGAQ